jgi:hypothetical protein
MRFEHAAAYAMGIGLPLLGALRRRQLENEAPRDVSGLSNAAVLTVKGALYAVSLVALWRSVQRAGDAA